jgi:hypothetical protein
MTGTVAASRKLGQLFVIERTDHDHIDVARQNARGIGERLAAPELHLFGGEHQRIAAELAHGELE